MRGRNSKLLLTMAGVIIFGCPLVAAFLARTITVSGGLQAEIQRIESQGAPTSASELRAPRLPRSMNAAPVYAAAAREVLRYSTDNGTGTGTLSAFCWKQTRSADLSLPSRVKAVLPRYRRAISLAEKASRMPLCRFPVAWEKNQCAAMPQCGQVRQLAEIVMAKAIIEAREGHGDEALRSVGTAFRMSQSLKDEPSLVAQLVRTGIVRQAADALRECLTHGAFNAAEVRRLLAVVSEIDLSDSVRFAVCAERAIGIQAFDDLRESPEPLGLPTPRIAACGMLERTLASADELCYLRMMAGQVKVANLPYREFRRAHNPCDAQWPRYAIRSRAMVPSLDFVVLRRDQAIAELSGSQAALQIELYRSRFGCYPTTLTDLRAKLACSLQLDPFSGGPLSYKQRRGGYVLYSIGPDLEDGGGVATRPSPDGCRGDILWERI